MTEVAIQLPNGTKAIIEASSTGHEADVAEGRLLGLESVFSAIKGLAEAAEIALREIAPKKATLEVGLSTKLEGGSLIAVFVKGSGEANIKVTLEW